MRSMRILALIPIVAALAGPVRAEADLTAEPGAFDRIEAGIICAPEDGRREAAPDTRLGYVNLVDGDITMGLAARRIPAMDGLAFGVLVTLADAVGTQEVTIIVTHPPMGPGGSTRDVWQSNLSGGRQSANFFRFEYPEERVPGAWTISAMADERVLYTAKFEVVDPAAMPAFISPCEQPPQLS